MQSEVSSEEKSSQIGETSAATSCCRNVEQQWPKQRLALAVRPKLRLAAGCGAQGRPLREAPPSPPPDAPAPPAAATAAAAGGQGRAPDPQAAQAQAAQAAQGVLHKQQKLHRQRHRSQRRLNAHLSCVPDPDLRFFHMFAAGFGCQKAPWLLGPCPCLSSHPKLDGSFFKGALLCLFFAYSTIATMGCRF